jgi:hypothetical protein
MHHALAVLGQFANAQGGNPALLAPPAAAMRGSRVPLAFPNFSLGGTVGASQQQIAVSQGAYRPTRLIIQNNQDSTNAALAVQTLLIGSENVFASGQAVLGGLFISTGVELGVTFPTAGPGISCYLTLVNNTTTTTTVYASFLGDYIQGGGPEIGG